MTPYFHTILPCKSLIVIPTKVQRRGEAVPNVFINKYDAFNVFFNNYPLYDSDINTSVFTTLELLNEYKSIVNIHERFITLLKVLSSLPQLESKYIESLAEILL